MAKKPSSDNEAYQQLKQEIKQNALRACYLFYGEEAYLREVYLEQIRKKLLDGPASEFNFHRFSKDTLDWDQVSNAVEAMPMMAERTLILVEDVDLYKEPEASREKIISMLQDLPDYCCLIFIYDTVPYSPDKRLKKLHAAISDHVQVVEFRKQSGSEMRSWIQRQARKGGKVMDNATADYLAFLKDNSLSALVGEIQKLTAYADGEAITKLDVDTVVEPTLTAATFDISNALADGEYEKALLKLRDLLAMQEDPILLLGTVAAQMRRLLYGRILYENGKSPEDLVKLLGGSPYGARMTMNSVRKLTSTFCKRAVLLCLEADRNMKTSRDTPERILELLILQLSQEARP